MTGIPVLNEQYRIERMLSSGTYSKVYQAFDFVNKRDVIVKVFESQKIWKVIYEKRNHLMGIASNHMPKIYSVEVINGYNCIIEEYIKGEPLSLLIGSNKLTYRAFFALFLDLLDALQVLHRSQLIHGDIKPQNVIVDISENSITGYLIDVDSALINQTNDKAFFGTLYYAAPEQVIDNKLLYSSDIYSLGLLAYVTLEGGLPYKTNKAGILERMNKNCLPKLSSIQVESSKQTLEALLCDMTHVIAEQRPTIKAVKLRLLRLKENYFNERELDLLIRKESAQHVFNSDNSAVLSEKTMLGTYFISAFPPSYMVNEDYDGFQEREDNGHLKENAPYVRKEVQRTYQKHLLKEYEQLSKQAVISFWLWVTTFILGLGLIIFAVVLIMQGKYIEAVTSVVLEALVYFAQRLFAVREEYYRKQNDSKIKHLEVGDYYEYLMSILETTDEEYRRQKLDMVLESIKKQTERLGIGDSDT